MDIPAAPRTVALPGEEPTRPDPARDAARLRVAGVACAALVVVVVGVMNVTMRGPTPGAANLAAAGTVVVSILVAALARPGVRPERLADLAVGYEVLGGVGIVLTGMGRDGGAGMLDLKKAGWHTIAQDEKTSLIYGMPKACVDLGAACEVLPLSEIGPALLRAGHARPAARANLGRA